MGGFFRFVDEDWSWNTSLTVIVFDLLEDRLPDGDRKNEMCELRDNNVLMLDLRDPSDDDIVEIIVNDLKSYMASRFGPEMWKSFEPGFSELLRLASAQHRYNQKSATGESSGGG